MPFKLQVRFSGICGLVLGEDSADPVKACILLPESNHIHQTYKRNALDNEPLFRHRSFLSFNAKNLSLDERLPESLQILRYFEQERLAIKTTPLYNNSINVADLKSTADLMLISPDFAKVDPALLTIDPQNISSRLSGQVVIDQGTLRSGRGFQWNIPNTLGRDKEAEGKIAHEVFLSIEGLEKVELIFTRFNNEILEPLVLTSPQQTDVEIEIANLCEVNPLRWPTEDVKPLVDQDFRWAWELLDPATQENLVISLKENSLPLPVPHPKPVQPDGQGMNCMLPKYKNASLAGLSKALPWRD
ncbi:MAG TPA: hypothetical protein VN851_24580 [Thermoanaerobaculia bacterium]|nr:hypothetical protein [Thermoanaerobaculia bacterium]